MQVFFSFLLLVVATGTTYRDRNRSSPLILSCLKGLTDILLAMTDTHLDAEFIMNMLRQMLGRIDAAMLASSTAKAEHQGGKTTLDVSAHMSIGQLVYRVQKRQDFSVVL
jgi:hypothetical protein